MLLTYARKHLCVQNDQWHFQRITTDAKSSIVFSSENGLKHYSQTSKILNQKYSQKATSISYDIS